ncbi:MULTISPECIES: hypothetical protein [Streptomyces]|uniref:hypothetical protein n=1 Tax=Streptomyces TaxID=1883 RepID=UPI000A0109BE|nr:MULTISPECIES: hypothetical protein [Streptomyces]ARH94534.1 hypothetical protein STRMOE7_34315 [Streptomyces sp. MOE7]
MTDEHRSADATAPRAAPCDEERRLARKALAGRARDADDLTLLMDMLGLDPSRDPGREAGCGPARGRVPDTGRGGGRERRRDTCPDARFRPGRPRG